MTHANAPISVARAPGLITRPNRLVNKLLELGMPMGPNVLVTIRGRISGLPRTQPLAIVARDERRWLIGTFGDTNWCRNLRANPDLQVRHGRRIERLRAQELTTAEKETFFSATLPREIAQMSLPVRLFGRSFLRVVARDIVADPRAAAATHPVFELIADPSATDQTA